MFQLVYAGLYSTFVFQKPDPDAIPPVVTPDLHDPDNAHEEVCFFCA
jgi:mRNA (guanine-N7-)-methyltransferase